MIDHQTYVILSLQTHLFDARQMKEHAVFIEATLPQRENLHIKEADEYKKKFENLLAWVVRNSQNKITQEILQTSELITNWTLSSEIKTNEFTGIAINTDITKETANLQSGVNPTITETMVEQMKIINTAVIKLLDSFIAFQQKILNEVVSCNGFIMMYSSMVEHLIGEAKWYRNLLIDLEHGVDIRAQDQKVIETFWAHIMRDHAAFIRGMLDPSQSTEFKTANYYVDQFDAILEKIDSNSDGMSLIHDIQMKTQSLRIFKEAATQAINECKLKSIILPLLADHLLREANHFIHLLLAMK